MRFRERIGPHTVVVLEFPVGENPTWDDYRNAGWAVLRAAGLELAGQTTVIKPNITVAQTIPSPDTGVTTHPGAVEGMIRWCRSHGAGPVRIVEHVNEGTPPPGCWGKTGYVEMAEAADVELLGPEIALADCVEVHTPPPVRMLPTFLVPRLLLEPGTVLLNVAKMKTHGVVITLSMKNMQGLVECSRRRFCVVATNAVGGPYTRTRAVHELWQRRLTECHVDLIRALTSAGLAMLHMVEGLVAREGSGFLHHGANRPMGLMLAGLDPVAVDTVTAWCMGFDPRKVIALETARDAGLGTNRLEEIDLVTLHGDSLVPVTDPESYAAQTPFQTCLGIPELNTQRPYDRARPVLSPSSEALSDAN